MGGARLGDASIVLLALLVGISASSEAALPSALDPHSLTGSTPGGASSLPGPPLHDASAAIPAPSTPSVATFVANMLNALGNAARAIGGAAGAFANAAGAVLGGLSWLLAALASSLAALGGTLFAAIEPMFARLASTVARNPERLAPLGAAPAIAWSVSVVQPRLPRIQIRGAFASLYSRLARHELLQHATRQRIFDFVHERPGAHVSQISQAMGIGWGTAVYHLQRLREGQLLTARSVGNQLCHFVNGSPLGPREQTALAAMKAPKAQAMVEFLKLRGPTPQHMLAHELGMSTALVSWHAKRLEEMGVVARTRQGRFCTLALKSHALVRPAAIRHLPTPATPALAA